MDGIVLMIHLLGIGEKLVKEFEDLGELRGNEGEQEVVWDEEGEL